MNNQEYYLNLIKSKNMMNAANYQYLQICYFDKDECILYQGQELDYLYILVSGCTKTCRTTANGMTMLAAITNPVTVIGEVEFLNYLEVANSIYALQDSVCFRISVSLYRDLLLNDLLFMRYIATAVSYRLHNANHNMSISINYPVENRLASYLVSRADNLVVYDNFVQVAQMIGCSYRQLQRVLNHFCQEKYISKIKRSTFKIINLQALKQLGKDVYRT